MLKTIEGIYDNGEIKLSEIPPQLPRKTKVIITFLESLEENISSLPPYNDLDYLAGTWNQDDELEFVANTKQFQEIDQ